MRKNWNKICICLIFALLLVLCTACQASLEQLPKDEVIKQVSVQGQTVYYLDDSHILWGMGEYNLGLFYSNDEWHSRKMEVERPVKIAENVKEIVPGYEALRGYISQEGDLYLWGNIVRKRVPTKMSTEKMKTAAITMEGIVLGVAEEGTVFLAYVPEEKETNKYNVVLQEEQVTAICVVKDFIYLQNEKGELIYYDATLQNKTILLEQIEKFTYSCAGEKPHCVALTKVGDLYEWNITPDTPSSPTKVQEHVMDVACGAEYIVWVDNTNCAYFSGNWIDTSSEKPISTFYEKHPLHNIEEGKKKAVAVFGDYENVFVIFSDENCMAWGQNWYNPISGLRERETELKGHTYMPFYFYLEEEGSLVVSSEQQ